MRVPLINPTTVLFVLMICFFVPSLDFFFFFRYIVQNDLLGPIFDLFVKNGKRNNMINSSILQLFEYIARENTTNNAQLVRYVAEKYVIPLKLGELQYVSTFQSLLKKYAAMSNSNNPMMPNNNSSSNSSNSNNNNAINATNTTSTPPTNANTSHITHAHNGTSLEGGGGGIHKVTPRGARKPPPGVRSDVDEDESFFTSDEPINTEWSNNHEMSLSNELSNGLTNDLSQELSNDLSEDITMGGQEDDQQDQQLTPLSVEMTVVEESPPKTNSANALVADTQANQQTSPDDTGKRPLDAVSQQDNSAAKRQKVEEEKLKVIYHLKKANKEDSNADK